MRSLYHTIPARVHKQLFTSPFLKCFATMLDAALTHPSCLLPAFIPDVKSDVNQREFLRLFRHNDQVISNNPNMAGKGTSILRIISCIHADGIGYFHVLHRLLSEAGCSSGRSCADDICSLDLEDVKRASRVCELVQGSISGAIQVCPCKSQTRS